MTRIGSGGMQPRAINQADRDSSQVETRAGSLRRSVQEAQRMPPPQDPKERAKYDRAASDVVKAAQRLDKASTDADKQVAKAGKALPKEQQKEVGKRVGQSMGAVSQMGTAIYKSAKDMLTAAKKAPGKAAKKAGKDPGKDSAKKLMQLAEKLAKMTIDVQNTAKGVINNIGN